MERRIVVKGVREVLEMTEARTMNAYGSGHLSVPQLSAAMSGFSESMSSQLKVLTIRIRRSFVHSGFSSLKKRKARGKNACGTYFVR